MLFFTNFALIRMPEGIGNDTFYLLWHTLSILTPVWLVELARVSALQGPSKKATFIQLILRFASAAELAPALALWEQSLRKSKPYLQ